MCDIITNLHIYFSVIIIVSLSLDTYLLSILYVLCLFLCVTFTLSHSTKHSMTSFSLFLCLCLQLSLDLTLFQSLSLRLTLSSSLFQFLSVGLSITFSHSYEVTNTLSLGGSLLRRLSGPLTTSSRPVPCPFILNPCRFPGTMFNL